MKQVVQSIRNGKLQLMEAPDPVATPGRVVIANTVSVISPGTERSARELARKSLLGKARERPDDVRRLLRKVRRDGLIASVQAAKQRLDIPMKLGYSSSGMVIACGPGVEAFRPGDRVASNGPHAGVVSVPRHLCAHVPEVVTHEQAAFAVMGAIALNAVRLARPGLGESVLVIGLGLVGQIAVPLLKASGCRVLATDLDETRCSCALTMGADVSVPGITLDRVEEETGGIGVDAVLVAAATDSSQPIRLAGESVRKKGRVVVVGAVGMNVPRNTYYFKEAELIVSCSYGPGRYDSLYEERGQDYPVAHVRWTEQRNLQAVLDLMASGRLNPMPLVTHRFPIDQAQEAYELIEEGRERHMAVLLEYGDSNRVDPPRRTLTLRPTTRRDGLGIGCIGAGDFARGTLLRAIEAAALPKHLRVLCSAEGLSAAAEGARRGFERITSDDQEVLDDPDVDVVFVLTRHHLHANQVMRALKAGKHVFVEKPLALTLDEIRAITELMQGCEQPPLLMIGFNRRFSQAAVTVRRFFVGVTEPLTVLIRFNAGSLPSDHWVQDPDVGGGRIVGEACHGIDLATYLVGASPVRVFAESVGGPRASSTTHDRSFLSLRHANGAASVVAYLAGGDPGFPKERVEVLGGDRLAVIEDFRSIILSRNGRPKKKSFLTRDKGHRTEVKEFLQAVYEGGTSPIPWDEIRAVSLASILAMDSLREGLPLELP